jgi:hypothetical protein
MVRPRAALLACFPPGSVTAEEASEALRGAGGDFEAAKLRILAQQQQQQQKQSDQEGDRCSVVEDPPSLSVAAATVSSSEIRSQSKALGVLHRQIDDVGQPEQLTNHQQKSKRTASDGVSETTVSRNNVAPPQFKEQHRLPPRCSVPINNLSDRQYCCVWSVEVFDDGYRPEVARALLARVARVSRAFSIGCEPRNK